MQAAAPSSSSRVGAEGISRVLSQCPRLAAATLPFYLGEAGVLAASPAGIYRGALELPLALVSAPLSPPPWKGTVTWKCKWFL